MRMAMEVLWNRSIEQCARPHIAQPRALCRRREPILMSAVRCAHRRCHGDGRGAAGGSGIAAGGGTATAPDGAGDGGGAGGAGAAASVPASVL